MKKSIKLWPSIKYALSGFIAGIVVSFLVSYLTHKEVPCSWYDQYVAGDIYYHNTNDGEGYIFKASTDEKLMKNVEWIAKPDNDSLAVFCTGKYRGYFNMHSGGVEIPAKYDHAWLFSEGVAAVDSAGSIRFIKRDGQPAFNATFPYSNHTAHYLFKGGLCIASNDHQHIGLINHDGDWALSPEYEAIEHQGGYWKIYKDQRWGLLDANLQQILPCTYRNISIASNYGILATEKEHICSLLSFDGKEVIQPMVISNVSFLYYNDNYPGENSLIQADCLIYNSDPQGLRYGLMTPDGIILTQPIYESIEAINDSLYIGKPQGEIISYRQRDTYEK